MSLILKGVDMPICSNEECVVVIRKDKAVVKQTGYKEKTIEVIQIPKGHGRLVVDKEILARAEQEVDGLVMSAEHLPMVIEWILDKCDTILEAEG